MKKKALKLLMTIFIIVFSFVIMSSCIDTAPIPQKQYKKFSSYDFLRAEQTKLMNGYDETITLKGTNIGGYLVIEQWMTALKGSEETGYLDHKTVTEIFVSRFGKEETLKLWKWYRDCFIEEADFKNIADMGMNVIRLPFSYMSVDPLYNNVPAIDGQKYNFSLLDDFVNMAEKYGLYTILDLHGAYGSQNGQDHSGEQFGSASEVDFFINTEKQNKTIEMWAAIAEHFKGNPAVAAYDILNEPGEKAGITTTRHFEFFDKVYKAIRAKDSGHIVMFESCWDGENLPSPDEYGWENSMYSVHNYSGSTDYNENLKSMKRKIEGVDKMNFQVPILMGEFNCYSNEQSWRDTLKLFNQSGWSWTSWTYKLNNESMYGYGGWGIYFINASFVTPDKDGKEEIMEKWSHIKTQDEKTRKYKFLSDKTLFDIMKEGASF